MSLGSKLEDLGPQPTNIQRCVCRYRVGRTARLSNFAYLPSQFWALNPKLSKVLIPKIAQTKVQYFPLSQFNMVSVTCMLKYLSIYLLEKRDTIYTLSLLF